MAKKFVDFKPTDFFIFGQTLTHLPVGQRITTGPEERFSSMPWLYTRKEKPKKFHGSKLQEKGRIQPHNSVEICRKAMH